jgi:hypothetical protein
LRDERARIIVAIPRFGLIRRNRRIPRAFIQTGLRIHRLNSRVPRYAST